MASHRIIFGDSQSMPELPDESIHLIPTGGDGRSLSGREGNADTDAAERTLDLPGGAVDGPVLRGRVL